MNIKIMYTLTTYVHIKTLNKVIYYFVEALSNDPFDNFYLITLLLLLTF